MSVTKETHGYSSVPRHDIGGATSGLCRKGWTAAELLDHKERITMPLVREKKGGDFREASWEEALGRVVQAFTRTTQSYGHDAVGVFGGGGLTNEKAYSLGKFARVALKTGSIDYNGRFCMSSAASALNASFGIDRGLPFPLGDLGNTEIILLVGSNLAETMPPVMRLFHNQRLNGGSLVVVDPRSTPTAKTASVHLQPRPGTDLAIANGLLHLLITENFLDESYISTRTNNFESALEAALPYFPERVERITGVSASKLREVASLLGNAQSAIVLTGRGAEQHANGTATVHSYINLALALGKPGKPNSGFGTLTGQGNGQGGREHGQKVDQLPGYRSLKNPIDREIIAKIWQVNAADLPYPRAHAFEMLSTLGQENAVRSLLVIGSNPIISAPDANRIDASFAKLDFLVVVDPFLSETAQLADVVLPSAQWAEETGTMTNVEGRVLLRRRTKMPPHNVKTDLEIIYLLADGLGFGAKFSADPEAVFNELRVATSGAKADYFGITYEKIERQGGVFWPCPSLEDSGQLRLFETKFSTVDGRAQFVPTPFEPPKEATDEEFPIVLTTGRILAHYQSGTQTRRVASLVEESIEPYVEMHPLLAQKLCLGENEYALLRTRRGSAAFRVKLTSDARVDTVFVPFHWGGISRANSLSNPDLDPSSAMPEFKFSAVAISPLIALASIGGMQCER